MMFQHSTATKRDCLIQPVHTPKMKIPLVQCFPMCAPQFQIDRQPISREYVDTSL